MGLEGSIPTLMFGLVCILLVASLLYQGVALFASTLTPLAWKLFGLRTFVILMILLLFARPYWETEQRDASKLRLLNLVDLSGSMNAHDDKFGFRRIELVRPFLDLTDENSWLNSCRKQYGKVENLGFAKQTNRMSSESWSETELGRKTALGDALRQGLTLDDPDSPLGSVVVFTDGISNHGIPYLEVAGEYRSRGIPVNVIGVGRKVERGDLAIHFTERKPSATAKEELIFSVQVENGFSKEVKTSLSLFSEEDQLDEFSLTLEAGEIREIKLPPHIPLVAGPHSYQVKLKVPDGDSDPSNDLDSLLVVVKPPEKFSLLYLSNQPHPLYPFLKRVLNNDESFEFNAIIKLGEDAFHAFGDLVKPESPSDPSYWMEFDAMVIDLEALPELKPNMITSLKNYVQKRGGGLLLFGPLEGVKEMLGGLIPVRSIERVMAKEDLSLQTIQEPLFRPEDKTEEMKAFLPRRLPGFFIKEQNQGARGVVVSRANGRSVLSVQAYGAGKVAYWGVPHDWRRALQNEDGAKEFEVFWRAVMQWLGEGTQDRVKVQEASEVVSRGTVSSLCVDVLGSDFEPSVDAMVKAQISGPDGLEQTIQLYPEGSFAGRYAGSFRPVLPGAYEVRYSLNFPDGESLDSSEFIRVSEYGEEASDLSYGERDLKMLAKLTGGELRAVEDLDSAWKPTFAKDLPVVKKKRYLAETWPIFIALFLAAGIEWLLRRQSGLR